MHELQASFVGGPDPYHAIYTRRGDPFPIGRPGYGANLQHFDGSRCVEIDMLTEVDIVKPPPKCTDQVVVSKLLPSPGL